MQQPSPLANMDAVTAAAVLDMLAAGIRWEVAENSFGWLEGKAPPVPVAVVVPPPMVRKPVATVPLLRPRVVAGGEVWACGATGGLVVVTDCPLRRKGEVPLDSREQALLLKILLAVGLPAPSGWVAVGQDDEQLRINLNDAAVSAWAALQSTHTLVLGKVALGTLLGQACGVEAWQGDSSLWAGATAAKVGVTYRPDLLLMKPSFKRLAWHHMLAWQHRLREVAA